MAVKVEFVWRNSFSSKLPFSKKSYLYISSIEAADLKLVELCVGIIQVVILK